MRGTDIYKSLPKPDIGVAVTVLFVSVLVILALWTRISGLGERQFAQDEYYFIKSVHNILEFGVPRFPSGGYYIRGIVPQYLTAISILLIGDGFFAYRLPSALFGIGTVVMAYFLGRQFLNRSWSILLAGILTFSSWEIEFSRFSRMYSAFQFVAVSFFWSLYRYSFNGSSNKRYLAVVIAMIAILTQEMGIFLALFLFLPFPAWFNRDLRTTISEQWLYITISSMILLIGLFLVTYDFRLIGVSDHLPRDFIIPVAKAHHWLSFGSGLFGRIWFLSIGALAAGCIAGWYVLSIVRDRLSVDVEEQLLGGLLVLAVCCAVFHQFAMCAVIMLVVVLREPKLFFKRPYAYFFALLAVIVTFWLVLLLFNQAWIDTDGLRSIVRAYRKSIRLKFFAFPDFYLPVLRAWADIVPVLGFFVGVAVAHQVICIRRLSLAFIVRNPVIPILIVVIIIGVRPPLYLETRYSYFIYPLVLCVGLLSAIQVGEILKCRFIRRESASQILAIALCLLAFFVSEDFNPFHLSDLNSDVVAFRTGRYERFSRHWYARWDFKRPAELVNAAASETSRIIVSRDVDTIAFYLDKEYIMYFPRDADDYDIVSRDGGTRELWSGKRMISSITEVIDLTQKAEKVWLLLYPVWGSLKLDPEAVWPGRVKNVQVFTTGRDKRIEVWKIELR